MASVLLKLDVLFTLVTAFIDSSFRKGARRAIKFMPGDRAVIERWTVQEGLSRGGNMERVGLSFEDTEADSWILFQNKLFVREYLLMPLTMIRRLISSNTGMKNISSMITSIPHPANNRFADSRLEHSANVQSAEKRRNPMRHDRKVPELTV